MGDGYGLVGYITAVRIYVHFQNDAISWFINTDQTEASERGYASSGRRFAGAKSFNLL